MKHGKLFAILNYDTVNIFTMKLHDIAMKLHEISMKLL